MVTVTIQRPHRGTSRDFVGNLRRRLVDAVSRLRNPASAADQIHAAWIDDRRRDFASQGATTRHGRWKRLKPSTIRRKGHGRILVDTGDLRRSIVDPSHPQHVFQVTQKGITLGTRHRLARIHADGGRHLAQRRAVDPTLEDRRRYAEIMSRAVIYGTSNRQRSALGRVIGGR